MWKPGTKTDASSIITALIMNQKSPRVITVKGNVIILRNSPRVALTRPMTSAAISAAAGPLTLKPGTTRETIQMASALKIQCNSILSMGAPLALRVDYRTTTPDQARTG